MNAVERVVKVARAIESRKDVDDRVGFAAWGDASIAIFPSYSHAASLEDMKVPVALVALEDGATLAQNLRAIATALEALGEL